MNWKICVTFFCLASQAGIVIAQNCYESSIVSPSPFMGNNGEIFKLADGSLWEVKFEYEYLYEYLPTANAPLIVHANAVLALHFSLQRFQPIGGRDAFVVETSCVIDHAQLSSRN